MDEYAKSSVQEQDNPFADDTGTDSADSMIKRFMMMQKLFGGISGGGGGMAGGSGGFGAGLGSGIGNSIGLAGMMKSLMGG